MKRVTVRRFTDDKGEEQVEVRWGLHASQTARVPPEARVEVSFDAVSVDVVRHAVPQGQDATPLRTS